MRYLLRTLIIANAIILFALGINLGDRGDAAEPIKVTMIQSFHSPTFATLYVARTQRFFEQEGVDLNLDIVRGDAVAAQALVGKTAPMAAIGGIEAVVLASKGIKDFIAVSSVISRATVSVTVRKDLAVAKGLSAALPIERRIAALRGLRIATASPGGSVYTVASLLLQRGGLDPKNDAILISMGSWAEMLAALKAKQVDAMAISFPAPDIAESEGFGVVLISLLRGDAPDVSNIPYDLLLVHREYAAKNPEAVRRVVRALGRAANFVRENPEGTRDTLLKYFDKIPSGIMDAIARQLQGAVSARGRLNEELWKNLVEYALAAGRITTRQETREGGLWTNEYNSPN